MADKEQKFHVQINCLGSSKWVDWRTVKLVVVNDKQYLCWCDAVGDELLRIDISVVPDMSLADACTILRVASRCPVRLTLLRQRQEPQSSDVNGRSTAVDLEQAGTSPRLEYQGRESSPDEQGQTSRWCSDELTAGRTPQTTDDEAFNTRRRSKSQSSDDVSRDLPVGPGPVGVHSTYIDLSTVIPPADNSSPLDEWNDESSAPAGFLKTQSSPTLDKSVAVSRPATFSGPRLAQSVEELYRPTHVRQTESLDDAYDDDDDDDLQGRRTTTPSSSSTAVEMTVGSNGQHHKEDSENYRHIYYNVPDNAGRRPNDGKTERVLPTPLFAERSNETQEEPTYMNHSNVYLQRQAAGAAAGGHHGSQPLHTAVKDPDLGGVERALRAPERCAAGGLAYYINLEDHHFNEFPGQRAEPRYHSADDLRASWATRNV